MRRLRSVFFPSLLCLAAVACQITPEAGPDQSQLPLSERELSDETNVVVLVTTDQKANTLLINASRRGYQLSERTYLTGLDLIMLEFERPPGISGAIAISDMKGMEPSATVGVDHLFTLQDETPDRSASSPRLYAGALLGWPSDGCRATLSIGIIDGDVQTTAPGLSDLDIIKRDFSGGAAEASEHATAVADLLVGPGKLLNTQLYAASVVSEYPTSVGAGVQELIRAINWMSESDIDLVNISLAGPYNLLLERVVERAAQRGMVIVAAAGNDGPEAEPRYPAAYADVIAVTAIDRSMEVYSRAVQGEHIDFSAPGVDVFVSSIEQGKYLSGTSVAAPFITALIASNPNMNSSHSAGDVRQHISNSAVDIGPAGRDPIYGSGMPKRTWDCY